MNLTDDMPSVLRFHADTSREWAKRARRTHSGVYLGKPGYFWDGAAATYDLIAEELEFQAKQEAIESRFRDEED